VNTLRVPGAREATPRHATRPPGRMAAGTRSAGACETRRGAKRMEHGRGGEPQGARGRTGATGAGPQARPPGRGGARGRDARAWRGGRAAGGARRGRRRGRAGERKGEGEGKRERERGAHLRVQIRRSSSPIPRALPRGEREVGERGRLLRGRNQMRERDQGRGARMGRARAPGARGPRWAEPG
jgi:hypothetical protein